MHRYTQEVVQGGYGLGTLQERVEAWSANGAPGTDEMIRGALVAELSSLSIYLDQRIAAARKMYKDIGMDAEREVSTLVNISQALRARANGGIS